MNLNQYNDTASDPLNEKIYNNERWNCNEEKKATSFRYGFMEQTKEAEIVKIGSKRTVKKRTVFWI